MPIPLIGRDGRIRAHDQRLIFPYTDFSDHRINNQQRTKTLNIVLAKIDSGVGRKPLSMQLSVYLGSCQGYSVKREWGVHLGVHFCRVEGGN